MTFNSYQRAASTQQNFKYNGVENVPDLSLNLNMTMFRPYDPTLGRFTGIDAMADFIPGINPYNFAFNNPVGLADPDGLLAMPWSDEAKKNRKRRQTARKNKKASNHLRKLAKKRDWKMGKPVPPTRPAVHLANQDPKEPNNSSHSPNPFELSSVDAPESQDWQEDVNPPRKREVNVGTILRRSVEFEVGRFRVEHLKNKEAANRSIADAYRTIKSARHLKAIIRGTSPVNNPNGTIYDKDGMGIVAHRLVLFRAEAIKKALMKLGIPESQLEIGNPLYGKDGITEPGFQVDFKNR